MLSLYTDGIVKVYNKLRKVWEKVEEYMYISTTVLNDNDFWLLMSN